MMINLPRYHSDILADKNKNETPDIWLSQGTTNLLDKSALSLNQLKELGITERETYEFAESKGKPSLVIGRPGLGTIRDCLAMGIPFLPIWDKMDPELNSNVNHLVNLGLFPHNLLVEMNLKDKIDNFLEQQQILEIWKNIWPMMSEDIEDICLTILSNF
jgi:UDP:flavonoid glycosyltransferase YjiC (YdhE family)